MSQAACRCTSGTSRCCAASGTACRLERAMPPLPARAPAPDPALGARARLCSPSWSKHSMAPHSLGPDASPLRGLRAATASLSSGSRFCNVRSQRARQWRSLRAEPFGWQADGAGLAPCKQRCAITVCSTLFTMTRQAHAQPEVSENSSAHAWPPASACVVQDPEP